MKKRKSTRSAVSKLADVLIALVCLTGIAVSLYFFHKEVTVSLAGEEDEAVGVVYFKKKTARRRLQRRDMWEYLTNESVIYNGDRIQTENLSEAYIKFDDTGSKIEIYENTMLQILQGEEKVLLKFSQGTINVEGGKEADKIAILTGDKLIALGNDTNAVISFIEQDQKSDTVQAVVSVTSGTASIMDAPVIEESAGIRKIIPSNEKTLQKQTEAAVAASIQTRETVQKILVPGSVEVVEAKIAPPAEEKKSKVEKPKENEITKGTEQNGITENTKGTEQTEINPETPKTVAKKNADFSVLIPGKSYTIKQNREILEVVPFTWTKVDSITIQTSLNPRFNSGVENYVLNDADKKGNIYLEKAKAGEIVYWRAYETGKEIEKDTKYPSGKIIINELEYESLESWIEENYGKGRSSEILSTLESGGTLNKQIKLRKLPKSKDINPEISSSEEIESFQEESSSTVARLIKQQEIKRIEEERLEREKLEKERLEQERLAAEAEAKRKAEEAARIKAEQEEKERQRKLEAERKAEAERKRKLEEQRKKEEAEKKRKLEEQRKKDEAEKKRLAEEAEKKRKAEIAAQKAAEEKRKAEEAAKLKAEQERLAAEAKRKAEEERIRLEEQKAAEEAARKAEELRKKAEELKRQKEEEARIKAEQERLAEEERIRQEEEKAAAEAARKAEELRLKAEELKRQEEEAARLKAEKEKQAAEEAARQKALEAAEAEKRLAEEEAAKKAAEEARVKAEQERLVAEAEARRLAEEEEQKRLAEEEARKKAEEEAARKAEIRRQREEKKRAEEERKAEEERLRKAEEERIAEENRLKEQRLAEQKKVEEEAEKQRIAAEEERKHQEELAAQKAAEEDARKKAEEAAERKAQLAAQRKAELIQKFINSVPELNSPADRKEYTEDDFMKMNKPSVTFTWNKVPDAAGYKIQITNSSGKVVFTKQVKENKYVLSDGITAIADDGEYEWSVVAMNKIDGKVNYSQIATRKFIINLEEVGAAKVDSSDLIKVK
ncbi:MAG: hypothetical protein MJ162_07825 [Treponema sp.]|nr:hypothetical protein [Treponema sp.]